MKKHEHVTAPPSSCAAGKSAYYWSGQGSPAAETRDHRSLLSAARAMEMSYSLTRLNADTMTTLSAGYWQKFQPVVQEVKGPPRRRILSGSGCRPVRKVLFL